MARPADDRDGDAAETARIKRNLKSLDARLGAATKKHAPPPVRDARGNAMGVAFRMAAELISAVLVGGFIGWAIDKGLGTSPAFLLMFFVLGSAAGIMGVMRAAKKMQRDSGAGTGRDLPDSDDDD